MHDHFHEYIYMLWNSYMYCIATSIIGTTFVGCGFGSQFMAQFKNACDMAEVKYPLNKHTVIFLFDQSSCHTKYDNHELLVKNILVKDGGP